MSEIRYVCKGSCSGEVTEDEFLSGITTCQDETCECYGEELEKAMYCPACDEYFNGTHEH